MQSIDSLHQILSASPHADLTVEEPSPGYPVIHMKRPEADASIALHGAHLMSWQPRGAQPVIYTSPTAVFAKGKAIRGGIPLCWPWFNAHPTDPSKPSHGIARNRFWRLTQVVDEPTCTTFSFVLQPDEETRTLISSPFRLTCTITIGATLEVSLRTTNTGGEPFSLGGALHTYFSVSDLGGVGVEGLEGVDYLDCVGERVIRTQEGLVQFEGEVDRIYQAAPVVRLRDRSWDRAITIETQGSKNTVVWNPWLEKAAALGDLPDEAFRNFVCIETANAGEDVINLAPNQTHTLAATIRI